MDLTGSLKFLFSVIIRTPQTGFSTLNITRVCQYLSSSVCIPNEMRDVRFLLLLACVSWYDHCY